MAKTTSGTEQAVQAPFLTAYHELFDSDDLWAAARQVGVVTRERKIDVPALVEAAVLAMSGLPGTQTTIFANYIQLMGEAIAPSSFYDRFTAPLPGSWRMSVVGRSRRYVLLHRTTAKTRKSLRCCDTSLTCR